MVTGTHRNDETFRRVAWDNGNIEDFYNPIRVVALFLTADELVICDSEVDSLDGDLNENIVRIMVSDIVSVQFGSERARFTLSTEEILRLAQQSKFTKSQLRAFRDDLAHRHERETRHLQEEISSWLAITRTDGDVLRFPILRYVRVGERGGHDTTLTKDEETVDRMMNELDRIVRGARQRPEA